MCTWESLEPWKKEACLLAVSGLILFLLLWRVISDVKSEKSNASSTTTTTTTKVTPTSITKTTSTTIVTKLKNQNIDFQN